LIECCHDTILYRYVSNLSISDLDLYHQIDRRCENEIGVTQMNALIDRQPLSVDIADRVGCVFCRVRTALRKYFETNRQRRALHRLDARLLDDIGLMREPRSWEGAAWRWPDWI